MRLKRAGIVLKNNKNEILLVKGRKYSKWSIPKGHVDGEETLEECAKREFNEETGENVEQDTFEFAYNNFDCRYYVYSTVREMFDIHIKDHKEVVEVRWVNENDIYMLLCNKGLTYYNNMYVKPKHRQQKEKNISDEDGWITVK